MTAMTISGMILMIFGTALSAAGYIMQRQRMKRKGTERTTKSLTGNILLTLGFCITIPFGVYYCLTAG